MKRLAAMSLALCLLFAAVAFAETTDYAKRFFEGNENEALYELFSKEIKEQIPFEAFDGIKDQLIAAFGALQSIEEGEAIPFGEQTLLRQLVIFEKQPLLFQLATNAEGLITGMQFTPYQAPEVKAPEDMVLPDGIFEKEIVVGEGEWALPGLVTLPQSGENLPAVVLVHGSGPNDRDETVGQTKLFRDLAYGLAQNGIAVIRYDKRTKVHGAKMGNTLTIEEETIEDAILAGKLLAQLSEVDKDRIFVLGHSLGGMMAPRIAKKANGLFAGVILAAGTPKTLIDIMVAQNMAAINQLSEEQRESSMLLVQQELDRVKAIFALPPEEMRNEILFGLPAYYLFEMETIDALETILELQLPTLILQGSGDFQVTPEMGLEAYKAGLNEAAFVTYRLYEGLNHMFTAAIDTQTLADYDEPLQADENVIRDMIDFMK